MMRTKTTLSLFFTLFTPLAFFNCSHTNQVEKVITAAFQTEKKPLFVAIKSKFRAPKAPETVIHMKNFIDQETLKIALSKSLKGEDIVFMTPAKDAKSFFAITQTRFAGYGKVNFSQYSLETQKWTSLKKNISCPIIKKLTPSKKKISFECADNDYGLGFKEFQELTTEKEIENTSHAFDYSQKSFFEEKEMTLNGTFYHVDSKWGRNKLKH